MSVITPDAPAFNRPTPPTPDTHRDSEMLNYYFDAAWTTKDIAEHFKLSVAVVAAWFQRPDIAALIDFITAANDRRARDIARENLPGTIDILLRIGRQREPRTGLLKNIVVGQGIAPWQGARHRRARRVNSRAQPPQGRPPRPGFP